VSEAKTHVLAAILAVARISRRQARILCNAAGMGGGSGDLSNVLGEIETRADREEIEALADGRPLKKDKA